MSQMPVPVEGYIDCTWPVDPGCLGDEWDATEDPIKEYAQALAGSTLRRLTGYRVGGCPTTLRPCSQPCYSSFYYESWMSPLNLGGTWTNTCGCRVNCECSPSQWLALPLPVGAVYEVKIDGTVFTDWYLDATRLYRTDGEAWPTCQAMDKPDTEVGTYSVTFLNSWPVDKLGQRAAGILASEYAKACGGGKCRLPANVTSIVRQGVSFEIEGGAFPSGFVGIREVDAYIALWNPDQLRSKPLVWSPGPEARVQR